MNDRAKRAWESLEAFFGTKDLDEMARKLDELQALLNEIRNKTQEASDDDKR